MSNGRPSDTHMLELSRVKAKIGDLKPPKDGDKAKALTDLRELINNQNFGEYRYKDGIKGSLYTGDQLKQLFDAVEKLWKLSNEKLSQDKRMLGGLLKVSRSKSKTSDAAEEILTILVDILKGTNFKYPEKIETNSNGQLDAKATVERMREDLVKPIKAGTSEGLKQSLEAMRKENNDSMIPIPRTSHQGLFSGAAAAAPKPQPSPSSTPKPGRKS